MNRRNATHEIYPEVDGVAYRPGVYKMPMVRMSARTDEEEQSSRECTGLNAGHIEMYGCE